MIFLKTTRGPSSRSALPPTTAAAAAAILAYSICMRRRSNAILYSSRLGKSEEKKAPARHLPEACAVPHQPNTSTTLPTVE